MHNLTDQEIADNLKNEFNLFLKDAEELRNKNCNVKVMGCKYEPININGSCCLIITKEKIVYL